jgi:hypothetical protein
MYKLIGRSGFIGALLFLTSMVLGTSALQAQIVGELEAKVPFAFHAENTLAKTSDLQFDMIGTNYFLRGIMVQDSKLEYQFAQSKAENTRAQNNTKMESQHLSGKQHKAGISKS